MTRQELHALVDAQYDQLESLQQEQTFLTYEQKFAQIWTQLGGQVLQATLGHVPVNPRKKTSVKLGSVK